MTASAPQPGAIPHEQLAALSHEFRTPLNGVIGMARLLSATRLTAEQRAYVAALMESGEHLLGLVNDVLDYARLGAGRVELTSARLEIEDVLRSVSELLSPRAHEKGIEIGWAAEPDLPPILADEGRLKQILLNFAGNAVKFVDVGGVLISAEAKGAGRIRFTVSDTGPGVPKAVQAEIFEAFAQTDAARDAQLGGAGLGLAIARSLATEMDGEVGVDSRPGRGADFWFEATFPEAGAAAAPHSLAGRTVLVASPSAIVREAAARQVEASGGRAVRCAGLDELADQAKGRVALIDHGFIKGRGRIRLPPSATAVVLLRPKDRAHIAAYRKAGFAGYLIKPLRRASLAERVLAAEGAGTPSAATEDERIQPADAAGQSPATAPGARVLLAEDNPINAMLARTLLQREGCQVDHVTDGAAALTALAERTYDLVLMDVRMPVMGGMEATRALRARGVASPVVALTANAFEDDRRACLAAGMDDFLVKPLSPEALRGALARWTGPRWTAREKHPKLAS